MIFTLIVSKGNFTFFLAKASICENFKNGILIPQIGYYIWNHTIKYLPSVILGCARACEYIIRQRGGDIKELFIKNLGR